LVITIDNTNQYDESNENNNQFVFAFNIKNSTIPPTQKINLIAKSIETGIVNSSDSTIHFNYTIENTKSNTNVIVNISIDGNNIKSESVNVLSGTNKYSSSISNSYSARNHVIQIFVDSNNLIDESNESDNKVSTTFKIINDNNGGGNNGGDNDNNNNNDRENIFISSPASQWQCTQWSECNDGIQTRVCTDLNDGYNTIGKPEESRICSNDNVQTISQILEKKTNNNWIYWLFGDAIVLVIIHLILIFAMMS
ncbi:MAG: CARDB domain-containing protein, partial [Nanoarchaeota archaeon]|nr:CARDB domain-containing protein [Nanoarchaeota archaeon]